MSLRERDPEIHSLVEKELARQRECVDLIASENYAPVEVLEATGSVLTNKYSEGYPGKRYYGGNEFIDQVENLAIDRAKKLFGADHANVQPHSGSTANYCAYAALMEAGDTLMGMELSQGGHLTHGSPVNFSGKTYKVVSYAVDRKSEMLDYDTIKKQAVEQKPKVIVCGYTAYPRTVHFDRFREIADACGAFLLADISHIAGLIAGGAHVSPAKYADVITTTTHKTLRGPRGAIIMCKADLAQKVDKAVFPGAQGGPLDHVTAAKAVCFHNAMQPDFIEYAHQVVKNSKTLADELNSHGLRLVSGGTDNHMVLVDLTSLGITGKDAQTVLERAGIICNRNTIPYDTQKPFIASGIRLGTPAMTTRGMKESEMKEIAALLMKALKGKDNADTLASIRKEALALCSRFPIYKDYRA
ncbi:MAG: serine hydroxymethyltransferase [Candidatus ainarchaeum sp.]|nr:serine hydroxymethyltransferase [Candidatus ainarchaeum sp.]MDD5096685.1 serine hydroxymethyltransferase [Candidatus ainarchaeum sp.]